MAVGSEDHFLTRCRRSPMSHQSPFCGRYQVRSVDSRDESSSVDTADHHVPSGGRSVCDDACAVRCGIFHDGGHFKVKLLKI